MSKDDQRLLLPTNVKPTHYTLTLIPDIDNLTFKGSEVIDLNINENSKDITLNANEIEIKSAKIVGSTNQSFNAVDTVYDVKKQTVTFKFPQEFAARSTASLHIEFTGRLSDNRMVGFYRSAYKDKKGETKHIATTQFEPTDARRAFPSWDEPAIKATFDITLIAPSDMTVLGNMDVSSETQLDGGKKEVKFNRTPLISTYLIAFIIGDLGYIETTTSGVNNGGKPVVVRVYAPRGEEAHGEFALNVAAKALEYFAGVFGIPYPLPKCDMVAVPDFENGAMENWGLITYRTAVILFDPKASDAKFKQRIAYTTSHELAHQWFGNLVTMEWWNDLWLNEGFATWVGYLAVDKLYPDWEIWNQYITEGHQRGLQLDSLKSSHPIEVPINDSSEIHQIFDAISYYKGSNVIRMLSAFLGEEKFLSGVRRYLSKHKYSNASTNDLWKALSDESGIDVGRFMTLWTKMTGYPVITVEESTPNTLKIRQNRFLSSGVANPEDDTTVWWVPLGIDLGPNTQNDVKSIVLTDRELTLELPLENDFYQLNFRKTGVFCVNYTPERLSKLGKAVKKGLLETSDRMGVIADASALASSGHGKTSGLLNLIKEFDTEEQFIVLQEIGTRFSNLLNAWFEQPEPIFQGLLKLRSQLFSKLVPKVGWEYPDEEDYLTTMLRALVIKMAGVSGDPDTVKEAYRRFRNFTKQNDKSAIHPNLRSTVFEIVLANGGGKEEVEAILEYYKEATADQKVAILMAIGRVQTDELIQHALKFAISEEVRSQDVIYPFVGLSSNRKSRRPLWNFLKENWDFIHEKYSKSPVLFSNVVKFGIDFLASEEDIKDIKKFFSDKDTKKFEKVLEQGLENIRANAGWVNRDSKDVNDWLKANGYLTEDKGKL